MRIKVENEQKFGLFIALFFFAAVIGIFTVAIRSSQNLPSSIFQAILFFWPFLLFFAISIFFLARSIFTETFVEIDENGVASASQSTKGALGKNEKRMFAWDSIERVRFQVLDEPRDALGKIFGNAWTKILDPISDEIISRISEDEKKEVQISGALRKTDYPLPCVMVVFPKNPAKGMEKAYNFHIPRNCLADAMKIVASHAAADVQTNYANILKLYKRPFEVMQKNAPNQ